MMIIMGTGTRIRFQSRVRFQSLAIKRKLFLVDAHDDDDGARSCTMMTMVVADDDEDDDDVDHEHDHEHPWPSGLRRPTQVRFSSEAWVRILPDAVTFYA